MVSILQKPILMMRNLVRLIVSSYGSISSRLNRTRLSDQRNLTEHSGVYVRLMMMKSWRKRCRNTYRNLGFGALLPFIIFLPFIFGCNSEKISFEPATDDTIVFLGNTFSEGFQRLNYFETFLYHNFPDKNLIVRNISWSADEVDLMPRPLNFPSLEEHLMKLKADVIFLSFGLNESYQGERGVDDFKTNLEAFISNLRTQNFNGKSAPRLILLSPIAYERLN